MSAIEPPPVTISQIVNIGSELKRELELLARQENGDATWLARRILRDWLERRSAAAVSPEPTGVPAATRVIRAALEEESEG